MKAYVLHGIGDLRYEETDRPVLRPGWALVRVMAAGICSSDVPRVYENGTYHFPTIPGHEVCGVVEEVCDRSLDGWLGKRVGIFPLIPCRECPSCGRGEYELCQDYDYIGSRRDGGFAEYVAAPAWNLIELSPGISFEHAALLEPAAVALHAVKRAGVKDSCRVCVTGTGSIGFFTAQWSKLYGASAVCIRGKSQGKRRIAEALGIEYRAEGEEEQSEEYDIVFEAVGTKESLSESIRLAAGGGKIVLIGNPKGDQNLDKQLYWKILRKQLTLTGTWNSSYESDRDCEWTKTMNAMADNHLNVDAVVTHVLKQGELERGLRIMRDKTEPYCKIVVQFNRGTRG